MQKVMYRYDRLITSSNVSLFKISNNAISMQKFLSDLWLIHTILVVKILNKIRERESALKSNKKIKTFSNHYIDIVYLSLCLKGRDPATDTSPLSQLYNAFTGQGESLWQLMLQFDIKNDFMFSFSEIYFCNNILNNTIEILPLLNFTVYNIIFNIIVPAYII